MLTIFKQIFVWWNQQTLGTRLYTFFYGKIVGTDQLGNKYYENKKKNKRWVIYGGEIDASKISNEWYSWMHYTKNKIENLHQLKRYDWQKEHLPNVFSASVTDAEKTFACFRPPDLRPF